MINPPPNQQTLLGQTGRPSNLWAQWFDSIFTDSQRGLNTGSGGILLGGRRINDDSTLIGGRRI